ncbi:MAG: TIGR03560 family F420-dependent LLM class oxidoreductase [bacterium]
MRFSFWPSPANSWSDTLALSKHAEETGWYSVWFADHFMPNAEDTSGPMSECWTTLAALAAAVPRVRIGALVTGNTYRHPAVLAKMAANVDNISNGRCVLGLGAGWQENEHKAYGIDFSTLGGRMNRFEEACEVIKGLFTNEQTNFTGKYYQMTDAPLAPKPVQQPLPLLIGGGGEQRTLRIAAKYADEWNVWGTPEVLAHKGAILNRYCEEAGRDPKSIKHSAQGMLTMSDDETVADRMRLSGRPAIAGTGPQIRALVEQYTEAGVDELIIPGFNLGRTAADTMAVMDKFANEVMAHFK